MRLLLLGRIAGLAMRHRGRWLVLYYKILGSISSSQPHKMNKQSAQRALHMRTQQIGTTYELESRASSDVQSSSLTFGYLASVVYKLYCPRYFLGYFVVKV